MTALEAAALGGPAAEGIPAPASNPAVTLAFKRDGTKLTLSWDPAITGFILESADTLPNSNWTAVPGVANNSISFTIGAGKKYFRLKKP
jgi:hypothetical protein